MRARLRPTGRSRTAPPARDRGPFLSSTAATELAHRVVRDGVVAWSGRALHRAGTADLSTVECEQVLRCGVADPGVFRSGQWCYHIHWQRCCVAVVFRSDAEAVVVDAWRKSR